MFSKLGPTEIIIIAIVVLILFGAKRIPDFAKGIGQGLKEFRKASKEIKKEIQESSQDIDEAIKSEETKSNSK